MNKEIVSAKVNPVIFNSFTCFVCLLFDSLCLQGSWLAWMAT